MRLVNKLTKVVVDVPPSLANELGKDWDTPDAKSPSRKTPAKK